MTWRVDSQSGAPTIHKSAASRRRPRWHLASYRWPVEGDPVAVGASGRPRGSPDRANLWTALDLRPYLSAQTTWGSDAHFPPPAVRPGPPAHPAARQGLAAPQPGRPWRTSGSGRGGSDPPVRGPGTGSGPGVLAHPPPLPSWGRYRTINPWREGHPNAALERGGSTRSSSGRRRCPNCSRRSPASVRPRGPWLGHPGGLWPRHRDARLPLRSGLRSGFAARPRRAPPFRDGGRHARRSSLVKAVRDHRDEGRPRHRGRGTPRRSKRARPRASACLPAQD